MFFDFLVISNLLRRTAFMVPHTFQTTVFIFHVSAYIFFSFLYSNGINSPVGFVIVTLYQIGLVSLILFSGISTPIILNIY